MSLKDAFAGLKESQAPKPLGTQVPKIVRAAAPIALAGTAKSRHPEFEAAKVYLRKATRKQAQRRWEDTNGGDFSDLVQHLLEEYLGR